ncbi:MAG: FHA domain-containing protein [Armatimonadetes bacterium]|nr:FHA domain-containing protein [Armatimonadota bacterium]
MRKVAFWMIVEVIGLGLAAAEEAQVVRVRDLSAYLGQNVSVKGRTGNIVEAEEGPGIRVYTLRDDYGDVVHVRWRQDLHTRDEGYPIFGATYLITGQPVQQGGRLYLDELKRTRMYSPIEAFIKYGLPAAIVLFLGLLGVAAYVRRAHRKLEPAPLWGYAEIVEGPQQGAKFALRGDEIWIGRGTDPQTDICLSDEHRMVSRIHGRLFRERGLLKYHDHGNDGTGSTYGSSVDGVPIPRGGTVDLPFGQARITLGGQTTLLIVPAGALAESGTGMASALTGPVQRQNAHEEETQRAGPENAAGQPPAAPENGAPDAHEGPTRR